ncbi:restriction endonuclease subunit S domain-containing protein [Streptomyces sp. UC4497]
MSNTERHEESLSDRLPFESVFSTVLSGWAFDRGATDGACGPADSGAVRLIWLKNIGRDGVIAEADPEVDDWRSDAPERLRLRAGDILLSSVISGRPKAAVVQEADLPAVAVRSLFILRPTKPLSAEHARLILAFLRSDSVGDIASGASSFQQHLPRSQLKTLELPNEDQALSHALADLAAAGQRLGEMAAEASALAESVFDRRASPEEARRLIIATGQLTRLRSVAAAQLDDPGFIVRTRFPYPIALRWRNVEAQRSDASQEDAQAKEYAAVLQAAETLLGYSALLTTALAHEADITCKAIGTFKRKIATGRGGGPGFADWQRILQQIAAAEGMSSLPSEHPLHELAVLLADDEAVAACRSLGTKRNSRAHGREDLPAVSASKLSEAYDALRLLLDRARFLADLQLLAVTKVDWVPHNQSDTITFRRLMGDNLVVPTETLRHAGPGRIATSLYLADRDQGLHLLSPFLTCEKCGLCAALTLFHADKEGGELLQTSLDHGHSYPYEGDEQALRAGGLQ